MERLTILGSAFAVANQYQENTYLMVETQNHRVLIDCGNNPVGKLEQVGVAVTEITDLILTHAHADHIGALPLLIMDMWLRKRQSSLRVYGLPFTLQKAKGLLDLFGWEKWFGMFPLDFHEVTGNSIETIISEQDLQINVGPVIHFLPNIGVRMKFPGMQKTFVYSSDSEPSAGLSELAKNADLLIQEAAGPGEGHSSPEEAGKTAAASGVKKLALIHYNAAVPANQLISEARQFFSGEILLAKDLMFFED